ncbi:LysR family transcriptional regulator [Lentilactobacillus fungorum]|uniref:LysR family transcriptional regulator n=1 Tax=Lentilactobacillus fungorum TaxID=2201250 RepID=A0ABQ3VX33_9LACO|nr:LysR family transcriptional regulator [Lentilactobacillus fungorum]GHP13243.1 LysR family transcriptional regulator [Lentilactobacillus fungorum]
MNIKDLQYYVSLSEEKNFSKVAQNYRVSQPTISAAIKRLEITCGSQLLVRGNSHQAITLTHTGDQLLVHAQEILYHYQLAMREIHNSEQQQLIVGMPPIIETNYFPTIAKQLSKTALDQLRTVEEGSLSALSDLKAGKLDVSFLGYVGEIDDPEIVIDEFDCRPFVILVARDHPLAKADKLAFKELKNEAFILFKNNFVHDRVFHALAHQNHIRPRVAFRSSETQSIINMVANNIGISLLTKAVSINDPNVCAIPLADEPQPLFRIGLAYRRTMRFSKVQAQILAAIQDELGTIDFDK